MTSVLDGYLVDPKVSLLAGCGGEGEGSVSGRRVAKGCREKQRESRKRRQSQDAHPDQVSGAYPHLAAGAAQDREQQHKGDPVAQKSERESVAARYGEAGRRDGEPDADESACGRQLGSTARKVPYSSRGGRNMSSHAKPQGGPD